MIDIIEKRANLIIIILLVLISLRQCGASSDLSSIKKELKSQKSLLDSLPNRNDVKIEGLNSEKRMIQATDRKMLDVQRQTEIERDIKILSKK
jgi:hypothetical protein